MDRFTDSSGIRIVSREGIRLDTDTGLHGRLVQFLSTGDAGGWAILRRDQVPFESAPYSAHYLYAFPADLTLHAESGHCDLTLTEARQRLTGREVAL